MVLPEPSVAVTITVVDPRTNVLPDVISAAEVAVQLSIGAGIVYVTTASQEPESVSTVISPGQFATGASLSFTVTSNVQVLVLPEPSVAVTVTIVVPRMNVLPDVKSATEVAVQLSVGAGII